MKRDGHMSALPRAGVGAAAGIAGTLAVQRAMKAGARWLPSTTPPVRRDPGEFAVEQVTRRLPASVRERIPERARTLGAAAAHLVYGATAGAGYALLRPRGGKAVGEGVALGLAVWAAGYLGWLPCSGLTPPLGEHTAPQLAGEIGQMAIFGMATAAAFTAVERLLE